MINASRRFWMVKLIGLVLFQVWGINLYFFFSEWEQELPSDHHVARLSLFSLPTRSSNATILQVKKQQHQNANATTIAYAISITSCVNDTESRLLDGAAVLGHSIHLASAQNPFSGSRYNYHLHAIVHVDAAKDCIPLLQSIGYDVLVRDAPVNVSDIGSDYLRQKVQGTGCCGALEFLKLYAYTLTQHPLVVHLDVDALVLQPLDDVFDSMLEENEQQQHQARKRLSTMYGSDILLNTIDAVFTRDYNMAPNRQRRHVGVQGGFLVVRPNMSVFDEYVDLVLEGNYHPNGGWGGRGYGVYYGSAQIQGLVSYYYGEIRPNASVELDKCRYNNMADDPEKVMACRQDKSTCRDCRLSNVSDITTAHFTLCDKPWRCFGWHAQKTRPEARLCRELTREWFRVRNSLETTRLKFPTTTRVNHSFHHETNFGYCWRGGYKGYIPLAIPNKGYSG